MTPTARYYRLLTYLLFLAATFSAAAQQVCPVARIVPERLPDLNIPRSGHCIFYANGELTVTGGHTTGFVPTPTAEYLSEGEWHQMPMVYTHDNGFAVVMHSNSPNGFTTAGEVIIGGGHNEPLGVGQSFVMERYRPASHSFEGFGCLDRRRVLSNATQLSDRRIIISGNHYAPDAIACYDGRSQVEQTKNVSQGRDNPYILPIRGGDALILGSRDIYVRQHDTVWVDRVKGEAFRVPLLEQWRPMYFDQPCSSTACSTGRHTYLLPATDESGQVGILMVRDTVFSLLPTACPIPMEREHGPILYQAHIAVDTLRQRGYLIGVDSLCSRQYVLSIDYAQQPAALTLYEAEAIEDDGEHSSSATITTPIVTPDGDLILAGGIPGNNYKPRSSVWLYRFCTEAQLSDTGFPVWLWAVLGTVLLAVIAYLVYYVRRKKAPVSAKSDATTDALLLQRICQAIERDLRYLTPRLRPSDIAAELGVSPSVLADCINNQRHCTFAQLITEYRVRHAQRLLAENPDMKLSALMAASGFTSEATFFRSFKAVTGLSPKAAVRQEQGETCTDSTNSEES